MTTHLTPEYRFGRPQV